MSPAAETQPTLTPEERTLLRDLAKRVAERAAHPIQAERIQLWKNHNDLKQPARPILYISPEGSWRELVPPEEIQCQNMPARRMEWGMRYKLYAEEHFRHDIPVTADWGVGKAIRSTGWGLEKKQINSTEARGAWHFDPVIHEPKDLDKIKTPDLSLDPDADAANLERMSDLFGDIFDVKLVGRKGIMIHLMNQYTGWRGLEEVMCDMYAEPEMLHDAMARLEAGHHAILDQYEKLGVLEHNSDGTYHNSGGAGWSNEFPAADAPTPARLQDMWGSAEAQEMAQVGPDQHREFVLEYEKRLLARFGRTGYGCCEDLTNKMDDVLTIPNIRRISCSPWADVDACAEKLGPGYVFSWKPHPSHLVGEFHDEKVRAYIRHTIEVCKANGCFLEMILKDTHTCENHPERFDRWCTIAREEIRRAHPDSPFGFDD